MTRHSAASNSGDALPLRPRFLQRRLWRLLCLLMPILAIVTLITGIVDLVTAGWSRQAAMEAGAVPLLASCAIMFALLGRVGLSVRSGQLTVREFLKSDVVVPISQIERVAVTDVRYMGRTRRVHVLTTASGSAVALVHARLYEPTALASLLELLPVAETVPSLSMRALRMRFPPVARPSPRLLGLVAAAYVLLSGALVLLGVSATMPRRSR